MKGFDDAYIQQLERERDEANAYAFDRLTANEILQRRHIKHCEIMADNIRRIRMLKGQVARLSQENYLMRHALLRTLDIRKIGGDLLNPL
jgi:hypothetical protein